MFSCFFLRKGKKGQIFPILIAIVVILIIAALITANLGKVSQERLYCIQAADAGVIAGASDYSCGYNKTAIINTMMPLVAVAVQTYLFIPPIKCIWCYPVDHLVVAAGRDFNHRLYDWANGVVRGYSEAVRKDAYYYAFINAGIDDKYRWDGSGYRDKPKEGESWQDWSNLESAFNHWLNETFVGSYWQDAPSITYKWQNGKEWVIVHCDSSSPEDLPCFKWWLFAIYWIPCPCPPSGICPPSPCGYCALPGPLPHGPIHVHLMNPSKRWVRMRVEHHNQEEDKDLGFWRVKQPVTEATAQARMTGGYSFFGGDFDLKLEE